MIAFSPVRVKTAFPQRTEQADDTTLLCPVCERQTTHWRGVVKGQVSHMCPVCWTMADYTITLDLHESDEGVMVLGAHSADGAPERARDALLLLGYGRARCTGPGGFYREVWAS